MNYTRRELLSQSIQAGAAFTALSHGRILGANDKIRVGAIGVGNRCRYLLRLLNGLPANQLVAMSDVYAPRRDFPAEVRPYAEYRQLLEQKDIDAVCIATVDHWHTQCSIDAMNTGKHVYVEKPMTRYLGEAFAIYDTVKKTGKKLQVGSQGCSDAKWHKAAELIRAGKLGTLVLGQSSYMRNNAKGEWNYDIKPWCTPDDVNWKAWLGPVHKKIDFSADHYFRWRKYYPYCAGLLGDLLPHRLHPFMLATGDPQFPTRVCCIGTKAVHTDRNTPGTPERDVAESIQLLAEFPSGLTLVMASASINEQGFRDMIQGHKASLNMSGNRVQLTPERPFVDEIDPALFDGIEPGEAIHHHEKNWFDCIRSGKEPNANIDLAIRVQTVISLAEVSERLKITALFDEKTRKITDGSGREIKPLDYGWTDLS